MSRAAAPFAMRDAREVGTGSRSSAKRIHNANAAVESSVLQIF